MKITMYELLGMIKDDKQPNHIVFDTDDWYWGYDSYIPYNFLNQTPDVQTSVSLFHRYRIDYCLNDEVEIIEEPIISKLYINNELQYDLEEKKIPKKLKSLNNVGNSSDIGEFKDKQQLNNNLIKDKLNEIVHYLQYLKSKGDE